MLGGGHVRSETMFLLRLALAMLAALLAVMLAGAGSAGAETVTVKKKLVSKGVLVASPEEESVTVPGIKKPVDLAKVGIIEVAPANEKAKNVLVLEPGTSAAGAYFLPFAKSLVEHLPGWQVWAVERRESFLEEQNELTKYKFGKLKERENKVTKTKETPSEQVYNYYLGHYFTPGIKRYFERVNPDAVKFATQWGMDVAVSDLNVVIEAAKKLKGKVVLGGHSLGGSVVTAYATWNFGNGKAAAEGLAGLVYDDGGSSPIAISQEKAEEYLSKLDKLEEIEVSQGNGEPRPLTENGSPWLLFGGISAPDLGIFSVLGGGLTVEDPQGPSQLEKLPLSVLPEALRSPIKPVTNEAGFGYSVNVGTSPSSLAAGQIHGGEGVEEKADSEGLHGWDGKGALTPVRRYGEMLSGTGIKANGSEWYFPARLTLDTEAVGNGLENPAQAVYGLKSTEGEHLPQSLHILAIDTELDKIFGGLGTTLTEAELLAEQSHISTQECTPSTSDSEGCLTLIDRLESYAHNDPAGALPEADQEPGVEGNVFYKELKAFLEDIGK